jgi:hypothetical protein
MKRNDPVRAGLDRDRDHLLTAVSTEKIQQLLQEEAEARRAGNLRQAAARHAQAETLRRYHDRLVQLDSDKMERATYMKWVALIRAHRATGKKRPKLLDVAREMGWESEQPLRDYCRELGVDNWHDVHAIVASARSDV